MQDLNHQQYFSVWVGIGVAADGGRNIPGVQYQFQALGSVSLSLWACLPKEFNIGALIIRIGFGYIILYI